MLAAVDPALLERVRFPLGEQTKAETRAEAAALGLASAKRAESQEACFLGGDDYRAFLGRQGLSATAGPIVDVDGTTVGRARRLLAVHTRPAARPARRQRPPALRAADGRGDEHRHGRRRASDSP